ncbi:MAG: four helix bundle protein [Chloroflexi bacterium]|nr:four helix bundle protein [Chloroflexota bacterium]MBU1747523.1 four helix bundle protein [Chloroflexota bacterium]MBU1879573.1 four helix bundle protein [Chloroflexota bacterium]
MGVKFERLETWQRAIDFANEMFDIADALPQRHQFSLGEQLRRAALSIPTNIAEGTGRDNPRESRYFYRISKGSLYECVSLLVMFGKRGHLERDAYQQHRAEADELASMITGLIRAQGRDRDKR